MTSAFLASAVLALGVLAIAQGIFALSNGVRFRRYVDAELSRPAPPFTPRAAVLLPCKGADDELAETLSALLEQDYPGYEVICAVESAGDPARAIIEQAGAGSRGVRMRCVVAGPADGHSQKIANLLAALDRVGPEAEVLAFLDSDAVPHAGWLSALVAPLADPAVGAGTGYRWYVPGRSLVSLFRCVWNASTLTFLGNHGRNFCWGGSTAIRRETFERLGIAERWRRVLSEDYELTRSVRAAGLRIHFAPRCVIPSEDGTTWAEFWRFARRQLLITRRCSPKVWTAGAVMALVFNTGLWGLVLTGLLASGATAAAAWIEAGMIYGLAVANGTVRQGAIARLFPEPALRRGCRWADALAAPIIAAFNLALVFATARARRFWWRGILYEMKANDRVRILRRCA